MKITISKSNSSSDVDEIEQIYRKLWEKEPAENADFSAAKVWWSSLSPKLLSWELKEARLKLKKYGKQPFNLYA